MADSGTRKPGRRALLAALLVGSTMVGVVLTSSTAHAITYAFSTGAPDGLMAMESHPAGTAGAETEAADDFVLTSSTAVTGASFTGLLPTGTTAVQAQLSHIIVEIYRVFPLDSDVGRTSGPPTFSTANVPTRVNSPSDVELVDRDSTGGGLTFSAAVVNTAFTATNSVNTGGIHPVPAQTTGGNGPVTGVETTFNITFNNQLILPAGHYFIVPQVDIVVPGAFFWLSAPKPNTIAPFSPDLQTWIRNAPLDPDWLRVGTDIVGGPTPPTFNASFTLKGFSNVTTVTGNVSGNLKPPAGSAVDIENATVTGNVMIQNPTFVRICNSTITGNLTVSGATGFVLVGDGGDDGGGCPGNHVGRSVRLSKNTLGTELGGTTTGGTVTLRSNSGGSGEDAAPEVENNHIGGSLICSRNSPAPINDSRPNTVVRHEIGQCAGL